MHRVEEWRLVFQMCRACGKDFFARNRHYEICSDGCRKIQAAAAKREFDERAKGDSLEEADVADYNYWYNRLRRLRKENNADAEAAFKAAFDAHRKEAVRWKSAARRGEMTHSDFKNWLFTQQGEADRLMAELYSEFR